MSAPTDAGIEVRGVALAFGGLQALRDASLDIAPATVTGLIGPNGAGKTTLVNVISGLLDPDAGSVTLGTTSLDMMSPHHRARHGVARTFQTPRVFAHLSPLENVVCGSYLRGRGHGAEPPQGLAWARSVEGVLEANGISGLPRGGDVDVEGLAFGTLRAIEIARVLLMQPRFLLLDEPAAGLDRDERVRLAALIRRLAADGVGIALIEHDVGFLLEVSDVVAAMDDGTVIRVGSPTEIRDDPVVRRIYLGEGAA